MNILKFGFFSSDDNYDMRFRHNICWSRIYEYPFVLEEIESYKRDKQISSPKIHNCSWGFDSMHVAFKTWLDIFYDSIHSDIRPSSLYNTELWDITRESNYKNKFDIVINVSTLEEVEGEHMLFLKNHYNQLKDGGRLIITFDYPGFQLEKFQSLINRDIKTPNNLLTPLTSVLPPIGLGCPNNLQVGYLVLEKN